MDFLKGAESQDDASFSQIYLSIGDSIFKDHTAEAGFNKAIEYFDKAIKADSTFALAYAKRAITRSWGYNAGHFTAKDHKDKCRSDIERALELDKNLEEAWIAAGFYSYYFEADFSKALEYFRKVLVNDPDNWRCKVYMAFVLRAAGEWKQSQSLMAEVGRYDPQDALLVTNIGLSYDFLHIYDTAIYYHDKAVQIMPTWTAPYQNKIESLISRDGNTHEAEVVMDSALLNTNGRDLQKTRILLDIYNGRFDDALFKLEMAEVSEFDFNQGVGCLLYAEIYNCLDNPEFARNAYKSAFEYSSKRLAEVPGDASILSSIGIALAGLNDSKKAIEYGQEALNLSENNLMEKSYSKKDLTQIYVMLGKYEQALSLIDEQLNNPSALSVGVLQIDPVWNPLQEKPEFKKMLKKYSAK